MRRLLTTMALLGVAGATTGTATAQGPVREGLRRTGEIAAQGTQRVVEGTGRVIQGTGEAARNVAGATLEGTRRGVDALTPALPAQARGGATLSDGDLRRDARWRFSRHNGEWWYYSPENNWMYHRNGEWNQFSQDNYQPLNQQGQRYSMGYRGVDSGQSTHGYANSQHVHQVRTDRWGRQYICENGHPVYLDQSQGFDQTGVHDQYAPNQGADYAPQRPAEAGMTTEPDAAAAAGSYEGQTAPPATPSSGSEAQAELENRGVANPGNADAAGNSPEAPREVNNNPDPAGGSGDQTGAAKVQTPQ